MPMKPETILGLSRKFMESRIFLTAAELDIFSLLIKYPMSAQEIADKIQVTSRGITILLNALVPMCQWRRKTIQLWRDKIDHLLQKLSPGIVTFAAQPDKL